MRSIWLVLTLVACAAEPLAERDQPATVPTVVSLTFDDTTSDQAQLGALLAARGLHATFYVNSPRIGATGYMTAAQIAGLFHSGNEIGGHTLHHVDLTTVTAAQARTEICDDRIAWQRLGYPVTTFAYPFGAANATVEQIAADCGYNAARGVSDLASGSACMGCPFAERIPPGDLYQIKTPDSIKQENTLADIQSYVTQAEQHGGGWVPLVFHRVCDGCDENSVSVTTLTAFLDWLGPRTSLGTVVKTVDEVIGGEVQPASALQNGSLELDADADAVPDCWQRGSTGTNTAKYTLTSDAADGTRAQQIDITAFTSGARRIVTLQDGGPCSPLVVAGHAYTLTAQYHATTPPRFTVYVRDAAGAWRYFTQSATFPTSATYAAATFTTPALPSDAVAISFGLSIYAVGSITMDALGITDFTLTDTTPPTAAVGSPAAGATVTGTVPIVATTSDNFAVVRVRFYRDGVQLGTRTATPFRWNWDTSTTTHGAHTLEVQAEDAAGNVKRSAAITVTVQ